MRSHELNTQIGEFGIRNERMFYVMWIAKSSISSLKLILDFVYPGDTL